MTDTSRWNDHIKNRRARSTVALATASEIAEEKSTSSLPGHYLSAVTESLKEEINNPASIHQGTSPGSPVAILAFKICLNEPDNYAPIVRELALNGVTKLAHQQEMVLSRYFRWPDGGDPAAGIPGRSIASLLFQDAATQFIYGYGTSEDLPLYEYDTITRMVVNPEKKILFSGFSALQIQNIYHRFLFRGTERVDSRRVPGGVRPGEIFADVREQLIHGRSVTAEVQAGDGPLSHVIEIMGVEKDRIWFFDPARGKLFPEATKEMVPGLGPLYSADIDSLGEKLLSVYLECGTSGLFTPLTPAGNREFMMMYLDKQNIFAPPLGISTVRMKDYRPESFTALFFQYVPG